jgi:L-alanine-DL-glutamate epimerase-like enolase superfamily enzyme
LPDPIIRTKVCRWPLRRPFAISRYVFTDNLVLEVTIEADGFIGRGECEPHEFDEDLTRSAEAAVLGLERSAWDHLDPIQLNVSLRRSPWRNAIDCALWDLMAKRQGRRIWEILDLDVAFGDSFPVFETIALDTPERMADFARLAKQAPGLKLKLGSADGLDCERLEAVRSAAPGLELTIDANEGWSIQQLSDILPLAQRLDVTSIEQPVSAALEEGLSSLPRLVPLCADESCLDRSSLPRLTGLYDMINIKLDKTGGLTEALALQRQADALGLKTMIGCNGGSSLAQAPATLLAPGAVLVDLGSHWLAEDHQHGLETTDFRIGLPKAELWG